MYETHIYALHIFGQQHTVKALFARSGKRDGRASVIASVGITSRQTSSVRAGTGRVSHVTTTAQLEVPTTLAILAHHLVGSLNHHPKSEKLPEHIFFTTNPGACSSR